MAVPAAVALLGGKTWQVAVVNQVHKIKQKQARVCFRGAPLHAERRQQVIRSSARGSRGWP